MIQSSFGFAVTITLSWHTERMALARARRTVLPESPS